MKKLHILFAFCLALAMVAVSAGAVYAEKPERKDYTEILEYFGGEGCESVLLEDYKAGFHGTLSYPAELTPTFGEDDGTDYISFTRLSDTAYSIEHAITGKGGLNIRFKAEAGNAENAGGFLVSLLGDSPSSATTESAVYLAVDFAAETPVAFVDRPLLDGAVVLQSPDSLSLTEGKWYTLSVLFNDAKHMVCVSLTDGTDETFFGMDVSTILSKLNQFEVSFTNERNPIGSKMYIDYIDIYRGSVMRNNMNKINEIDAALKEMFAALAADETDALLPMAIETVAGVKAFGYSGSAEVNAKIADFDSVADAYNVLMLLKNNAAIDTDASYTVRKALQNAAKAYYDAAKAITGTVTLPTEYNEKFASWIVSYGLDDTAPADAASFLDGRLSSAVSAYEAEGVELSVLEADSSAFISNVMSFIYDDATYLEESEWIEMAENLKKTDDYPGVSVAMERFRTIKADFEKRTAKANDFLAAVAIMNDPVNNNFGARYTAFSSTPVFDDETFFKVEEGVTVNPIGAALVTYNELKGDLSVGSSYVSNFLSIVSKASSATNYVNRTTNLEVAGVILAEGKLRGDDAIYTGYNGLDKALADYDALMSRVDVDKENAEAYILKVLALKDATTFTERKKLALEALELKKSGDVTGYIYYDENDSHVIGNVKDTNTALSEIYSEICLIEGYSQQFINNVNELKKAVSLADRLDAIIRANNLLDRSEDLYPGVPAAKTALRDAKNAYNTDAVKMNTVAKNAVSLGADLLGSAAPAVLTETVADVIKKIRA